MISELQSHRDMASPTVIAKDPRRSASHTHPAPVPKSVIITALSPPPLPRKTIESAPRLLMPLTKMVLRERNVLTTAPRRVCVTSRAAMAGAGCDSTALRALTKAASFEASSCCSTMMTGTGTSGLSSKPLTKLSPGPATSVRSSHRMFPCSVSRARWSGSTCLMSIRTSFVTSASILICRSMVSVNEQLGQHPRSSQPIGISIPEKIRPAAGSYGCTISQCMAYTLAVAL